MIVQLNLLPDVKMNYLKVGRTKKLIYTVAVIVFSVSILLTVVLYTVVGIGQKKVMNDNAEDIKSGVASLKNKPELEKVLTIQNQINGVNDLHIKKPATVRVIKYMNQLVPANADITQLNIDMVTSKITMNGTADDVIIINKFADVLKFSTFSVQGQSSAGLPIFSEVVTAPSTIEKKASFSIVAKFDTAIFDNTKEIVLTVPKTITTRSEVEKPRALFSAGDTQ